MQLELMEQSQNHLTIFLNMLYMLQSLNILNCFRMFLRENNVVARCSISKTLLTIAQFTFEIPLFIYVMECLGKWHIVWIWQTLSDFICLNEGPFQDPNRKDLIYAGWRPVPLADDLRKSSRKGACLKRRHVNVAKWPSGRAAEIKPYFL